MLYEVITGPAAMIEAAGIELLPFIAGDVQQVLEHYLQGRTFDHTFRMPGCGRNICCRGKIRRGRSIRSAHPQPERESGSPPSPCSMSARAIGEQPAGRFPDAEGQEAEGSSNTNP